MCQKNSQFLITRESHTNSLYPVRFKCTYSVLLLPKKGSSKKPCKWNTVGMFLSLWCEIVVPWDPVICKWAKLQITCHGCHKCHGQRAHVADIDFLQVLETESLWSGCQVWHSLPRPLSLASLQLLSLSVFSVPPSVCLCSDTDYSRVGSLASLHFSYIITLKALYSVDSRYQGLGPHHRNLMKGNIQPFTNCTNLRGWPRRELYKANPWKPIAFRTWS